MAHSEVEVKATRLTGNGTVYSGRCRVMALHYVDGASAGTLTFTDGGAGGTSRLVVDTGAGAGTVEDINIPARGILFKTDCYVTLAQATSVTVFYEAG